jgi:hypothetical protein
MPPGVVVSEHAGFGVGLFMPKSYALVNVTFG